MLAHSLFDRSEHVIATQVELDDVRLGEKMDFMNPQLSMRMPDQLKAGFVR